MSSTSDPGNDPYEETLARMTMVYNTAENVREDLCNKFATAVDNINFTELSNEAPRVIETQLAIVDRYTSLLSDREKAFKSRVDVALKHKDLENQQAADNNASSIIAEFLTRIPSVPVAVVSNQPPTDINAQYEQTAAAYVGQIDDVKEGELRDNPYDLK